MNYPGHTLTDKREANAQTGRITHHAFCECGVPFEWYGRRASHDEHLIDVIKTASANQGKAVQTGAFWLIRNLPMAPTPGVHLSVVVPGEPHETVINSPLTKTDLLDLIEQATKALRGTS